MASSIGIKIANGEFYPLLEENSLLKKRLVLTTVHDNQPSMQIDLYRSTAASMTDAQYIGSLVVENIKHKEKGEPSIEMVISSNADGEIIADAIDLDTGPAGEHYVLTVSLKSLDEASRDLEIPDFELENNEGPPSSLYRHAQRIRNEKKPRRSLTWLFILIGLIVILGLLAVWLFLFGGMELLSSARNKPDAVQTVQPAPPTPAKQPEPASEPVKPAAPEPVVQSEPVPVIQAPASPPAPRTTQTARRRPPPPVASYNVPAVIPREGVNYRIRYGDTLWDIAEAFYRDPWLYPRIARHNNIRNPNYIISGRTIRIPPKN